MVKVPKFQKGLLEACSKVVMVVVVVVVVVVVYHLAAGFQQTFLKLWHLNPQVN